MTHVERVLAAFPSAKATHANEWMAHCKVHDDETPSLSIKVADSGKVLLHCHACDASAKDIVEAAGLEMKHLFPASNGYGSPTVKKEHAGEGGPLSPVKPVTPLHSPGLRLKDLAEAKKLPEDFLRDLGLSEIYCSGRPCVRIPYKSRDGEPGAVRRRLALQGSGRFRWKKGSRLGLYGLDRLPEIKEMGWVILVEGESDCWTAWHHGLPALGIPGKTTWQPEWKEHLQGLRVYLWQEPDAADLVQRVARDVSDLLVIASPEETKDLSDAHVGGDDVATLVGKLKGSAVPASTLDDTEKAKKLDQLRQAAGSVLAEADPLPRVETAVRALGYGGDLRPVKITYLAATSRLLAMRDGSMPVHLLLMGPASAGKSYTLKTVLKLLPEESRYTVEAGSPRVLVYEEGDLRHKIAVFSEADSLPAGEDNPAASAVRNLLQEHQLKYKVTIRDSETGAYKVTEVCREGPTVLITTAVRRLGDQLDSRLFTLDVADDHEQVRSALRAQASLELHGPEEPDAALIAFQAYLQTRGPWDVSVPFAAELADAIGAVHPPGRVLRAFSRLLSLIKAVTVLRHARRERDEKERLVATIDDYAYVHGLVGGMFDGSISGATDAVRRTVEAVQALSFKGSPSLTDLASHLDITTMSASRRVQTAITHGWLVNEEDRRGRPAILRCGDPLPARQGLPAPTDLSERYSREPQPVTPSTIPYATPKWMGNGTIRRREELSRGTRQREFTPPGSPVSLASRATRNNAEARRFGESGIDLHQAVSVRGTVGEGGPLV